MELSKTSQDSLAVVKFMHALADDCERHGAATMRTLLESNPVTFRKLFTRFADGRRIELDISDEQLAQINVRFVAGLRLEARSRMH